MLKILITGGSGQLGTELKRTLRTMHAEIGLIDLAYQNAQVVWPGASELDVTDVDAVMAYCMTGKFDLIINCAAMTNVDACEADYDAANRVNAVAPGYLAKAAAALGAKLVHVSTDYVFPGNQEGDRIELDPTGPLSAYGRTKLAGERNVAKYCDSFFIVRTAWLYGYSGKNFVKTMLHAGSVREEVFVVDDQMGNPTSANDVAYEILKIALTDDYGIYHCTNEGRCSWADFAKAIMKGARLGCEVKPCTSFQYKQANPASAPRPAFSSLRNKHLEDTIGDEMRPWETALSNYLDTIAD